MIKIIQQSEKVLYAILAMLIVGFVANKISDLIYPFSREVSQPSSPENKSIALTAVLFFINILIVLQIFETFKGDKESILRRLNMIILLSLTFLPVETMSMNVEYSAYQLLLKISILTFALCTGYYLLTKNQKSND